MIINLHGKIGSGKDITGQIIQHLIAWKKNPIKENYIDDVLLSLNNYIDNSNNGWEIKKFADKLKDIVCLLIGCTREQLEDREFRDIPLGEEWDKLRVRYSDGYDEVEEIFPFDFNFSTLLDVKGRQAYIHSKEVIKLTPRILLQLLGTEAGRDIIHPDLWCITLFSDYDKEIWKDIPGFEDKYQISSYGNVKSLDRLTIYGEGKGEYHNLKGQYLKGTNTGGYLTVGLGGKTTSIHSLVAESFCIGKKEGFVINHKDGNKLNNYWKNLEYITQSENIKHNVLIGINPKGESISRSKLKEKDVIEIKKLIKEDISVGKLSKLYKVSKGTIHNIKKGKSWSYLDKIINPVSPILPPNWIITDNRFPNETKRVKKEGGITIKIERDFNLRHPGYNSLEEVENKNIELYKQITHYSEIALDDYNEWDYIIQNNGTIEELIEQIRLILVKENII